MITCTKENNIIRILQNDKKIYTVAEKTYMCLNKMGLGVDHIIDMIQQLHSITLPTDDKVQLKSFFTTIEQETKTLVKNK